MLIVVRQQVIALLVSLQFLTTCPPILRRSFSAQELGRAVGWFPVVGLLLGLILTGFAGILSLFWSPGVAAALLLAIWVICTGAIHIDGFLDSCDGLLGGFTPEARLRIMRDERIGGYAFTGGAVLLLIKYAALAALGASASALIVAPVLGRWAMSAAIILFPYARETGLGRDMKDQAGPIQLVVATMAAVAVGACGGRAGLIALPVAAAVAALAARFILGRLPGLTGDTYGAICEAVETSVLLTFLAVA